MSENQLRAQDRLTAGDLLVRGASVVGLLVGALAALLAMQPI